MLVKKFMLPSNLFIKQNFFKNNLPVVHTIILKPNQSEEIQNDNVILTFNTTKGADNIRKVVALSYNVNDDHSGNSDEFTENFIPFLIKVTTQIL